MLIDYYEILILSLIQGISEFIPVSSSAHLYVISELFDFKNQSLMIDVGVHLGSLLGGFCWPIFTNLSIFSDIIDRPYTISDRVYKSKLGHNNWPKFSKK